MDKEVIISFEDFGFQYTAQAEPTLHNINLTMRKGEKVLIAGSFSHKTDGDILNVILSKEPSYVGMLGGKPKIRALFTKLKENGYSEDVLKQIHAPIGLDIGGEKPAEIAVSIMAEILASRYGGSCRPMRDILRDSVFPL